MKMIKVKSSKIRRRMKSSKVKLKGKGKQYGLNRFWGQNSKVDVQDMVLR